MLIIYEFFRCIWDRGQKDLLNYSPHHQEILKIHRANELVEILSKQRPSCEVLFCGAINYQVPFYGHEIRDPVRPTIDLGENRHWLPSRRVSNPSQFAT